MLADLGRRLRFEPDDVGYILPFEEVVEALGRVSEQRPRAADDPARLDRRHRRPHEGVRSRLPPHEPAAAGPLAADRRGPAARRVVPADLRLPHRGAALRARRPPPRVGRALARPRGHRRLRDRGADARRPGSDVRVSDLPIKGHERLFRERVPLDPERRSQIKLSDPWDYGSLAEGVEAWGFRAMQGPGVHGPRGDRAPVVRRGLQAGHGDAQAAELVERGETETDAYMRIVAARYMLLRTHDWSDEVLERLRSAERGAGGARAGRRGAAVAGARPTDAHAPGPMPGACSQMRSRRRPRGCRRRLGVGRR